MSSFRAVGIDVSAKHVHVSAEGRGAVATFDNTPAGFKKLRNYITKGRVQEVRVVMEATGSYHIDLACSVDEHKKCRIMVVNPRVAKAFQAANGGRAKTDAVDAIALMHFAQRMEFVPWTRPSDQRLELRATSRYVDQLVKQQTRLKNQLEAARATSTTADWVIQGLAQQLEQTEAWVAMGKRKLVETAKTDADTAEAVEILDTIPGIAAQSAAQLVAEFSFLGDDMTGKQVTAWAGLDPLPRESGTSVRGRRGMSKRGNGRVRRILFMCAQAAARKGPLKALKERVAARSGKKMVGVGAVMRKLLTVAWAMYRSRQPWDAEKVGPRKEKVANAA